MYKSFFPWYINRFETNFFRLFPLWNEAFWQLLYIYTLYIVRPIWYNTLDSETGPGGAGLPPLGVASRQVVFDHENALSVHYSVTAPWQLFLSVHVPSHCMKWDRAIILHAVQRQEGSILWRSTISTMTAMWHFSKLTTTWPFLEMSTSRTGADTL